MAQPTSDVPPLRVVGATDATHELADSLERMIHTFNRARNQMLAKARYDVEWSAIMIIGVLVRGGPMRSGALAEIVQSDPSTISRQVATLVKDGYIERQADPVDGRATVLVATEKAHERAERHKQFRNSHYDKILDAWSDSDVHRFADLVSRFVTDFEEYRSTLDESGWMGQPEHAGNTLEGTS